MEGSVCKTLRIISRLTAPRHVSLYNSSRNHHLLNASRRTNSELINSFQGRNHGVQSVYKMTDDRLLPALSSVNDICVRCSSSNSGDDSRDWTSPLHAMTRGYNKMHFEKVISRYEEFSSEGFEVGVKQAFVHVTRLIKAHNYDGLEGLFAPEALEKIMVSIDDMSNEDYDILDSLDLKFYNQMSVVLNNYFVGWHEGDEAEAVVGIDVTIDAASSVVLNCRFTKLLSPEENDHSWMISDFKNISIMKK